MKKKLRSLLRIVFGRTAFMLLFIMLQLAFFFGIVHWISSEYSLISYAGLHLLGTLTCIYIYNKPENPSFKLSWIIPVLAFPVFGTLLYLYVELEISGRIISKRANRLVKESRIYLQQDQKVLSHLEDEDDRLSGLVNYVGEFGGFPVYENYTAEYFPSGEQKFERLKEELEKARKFIFMEYFIVEHGVMWDTILEILERKAKEGVEVRFMYDGMCSIALLPYHYPKMLEAKGIHCHAFAPIKPALSTYQNNRDHRKIVVIDGHTAFTGGVNLADEYINVKERFGYWKDVAVMIKGEAVKNFTIMFLEMWNIWEKTPLDYEKYLSHDLPQQIEGRRSEGFVLPYGDSPLDHEPVGKMVYLDILNTAKKYVHIMTPYLILDDETINALRYAAKRGVDVKIIMPDIPDKKYAFLLAHTYYLELMDAGVQIYQFRPGFVHAKVFTSDDTKAVVGSINLDFRSLYHHFECAAFMYKNQVVGDIENDFQSTLEKCRRIGREEILHAPLWEKLAGTILKLIAPMM